MVTQNLKIQSWLQATTTFPSCSPVQAPSNKHDSHHYESPPQETLFESSSLATNNEIAAQHLKTLYEALRNGRRQPSSDNSSVDTSMCPLSPLSLQEVTSDEDDMSCLTPPSSPVAQSFITSELPSLKTNSPLLSCKSITPEASPVRISSPASPFKDSLPELPRRESSEIANESSPRASTPTTSDSESTCSSVVVYEPWFEDTDSDFDSIVSGYPDDENNDPSYDPTSRSVLPLLFSLDELFSIRSFV